MNNAIVGERLKGLYQGLMQLSSTKNNEDIFALLASVYLKNSKILFSKDIENVELSNSILPDILMLMERSNTSFGDRVSIIKELKRLKNVIISKINAMGQSISAGNHESELLLNNYASTESKLLAFTDEYERTRTKLADVMAQSKKNRMNTEKVCENCSKVFTEENNYNWSCATHSGVWGGFMYWCCGNNIKESPGCQNSKHSCKEDNEEIDDVQAPQSEKTLLCTSCLNSGHLAKDCILDPNSPKKKNVIMKDLKKKSSQISIDKLNNVYQKQNKDYKINKYTLKIHELKSSLTNTDRIRKAKTKKTRSNLPSASISQTPSSPLTPNYSSSSIIEGFPRLSSRKITSSTGKSVSPI